MARPFQLKFNFDVSTFRLLGRELITDRITALFELVKNCYDANSDKVTLTFHNVSRTGEDSYICIADDGLGMSLNDIRYKWMVIGTNSKRVNKISPPPYNRKVVGEKGVGRFAVEKLGSKVRIETTQKGTTRKVILDLDWRKYDELSNMQDIGRRKHNTFFTEIENECRIEFYTCYCLTANGIGKEFSEANVLGYFGYKRRAWVVPSQEELFVECATKGLVSYIEGQTLKQCAEDLFAAYNSSLKKAKMTPAYIFLLRNKQSLVTIINSEDKTIND